MTQFLRNMVVACLGMMLLVGMMTASLFISLFVLAAVLVLWIYVALRRAGVINAPRSQPQDNTIIEVDYVVVEEKETRLPEDKV